MAEGNDAAAEQFQFTCVDPLIMMPLATNTHACREGIKASACSSLRLSARMPPPWRLCSRPRVLKHKFAMGPMTPDKSRTAQARCCLPKKHWNQHKVRFFWTCLKHSRPGPNYHSSFSQAAANR